MSSQGTATSAVNVPQLISDIKSAVTDVLGKDLTTYKTYSEDMVRGMAEQAKSIGLSYAAGLITADRRDSFLKDLANTAEVFAKTLVGLAMVTVEKVWNAVVGVLWKAINTAINAALPLPVFPGQQAV